MSGVLATGFLFALALVAFALSVASLGAAPIAGPAGIYVISDTRDVPGEVEKFNLDHVSGFTLRALWTDLETADSAGNPVYDFSRIERTLEEVRGVGKKMTLEIFVNAVPAYILDQPGTVTWFNDHPRFGGTQVVPWDENALVAYERFLRELAQHWIEGSGTTLADHPCLETLDAPIVGLHSVRDLSGNLTAHPDYTRERLIAGTLRAVRASRECFPKAYGFLAFFLMDDAVAQPSLDDELFAALEAEFNGPGQPNLGYFQETLSDTGPNPEGLGRILEQASQRTYVMFQALRPWVLRPGEAPDPAVASGTPVTGFRLAWEAYGATYVEIYGADALHGGQEAEIQQWDRFFHAVRDVRRGETRLSLLSAVDDTVRLQWPQRPGARYRVQMSGDLHEWLPEEEIVEDGEVSLSIPGLQEQAQFFRLEVVAPGQ